MIHSLALSGSNIKACIRDNGSGTSTELQMNEKAGKEKLLKTFKKLGELLLKKLSLTAWKEHVKKWGSVQDFYTALHALRSVLQLAVTLHTPEHIGLDCSLKVNAVLPHCSARVTPEQDKYVYPDGLAGTRGRTCRGACGSRPEAVTSLRPFQTSSCTTWSASGSTSVPAPPSGSNRASSTTATSVS